MATETARYRDALAQISLIEQDNGSPAHVKVREFARIARDALAGPTHRTVTIPAREQHDGYAALRLTLPWVCLHCGRPRGEPAPAISFDGSRALSVDGWTNPCGHIEKYSEVRLAACVAS